MPIRRFIVNPDDEDTGNFAFNEYDQTRPGALGLAYEVERADAFLRGVYGNTVRFGVIGYVLDQDSGERIRDFNIQSERFILQRYTDIFGAGGVLLQLLKGIKDEYSLYEIILTQMYLRWR